MGKTRATALFALLFISALDLYASDCVATTGGVSVAIPTPEKSFTDVGTEKRNSFEFMVPSRNHLLCAFVLTDYLPHLKNPATGIDRYMVVEVSRNIDEKKTEITTAIFEQVVAVIKQEIGDSSQLNSTVHASTEEINNKLKAVQNSKDISIDKLIPLGTIFQTTDAYGFLFDGVVSSGGTTTRIVAASILIKVRNRLIFAYVYGAEAESSLKWVRTTAEEWTREILAANSSK
jgi:hypothetical protein